MIAWGMPKLVYSVLRRAPTLQDIHRGGQGTLGQAYRIGLAGIRCPQWCPRNTACHAAWRAGRDNRHG